MDSEKFLFAGFKKAPKTKTTQNTQPANGLGEKVTNEYAKEGEIESPFALGVKYIQKKFGDQAEALKEIGSVNDPDERHRRALALNAKLLTAQGAVQSVARTEAMTDQEQRQLRQLLDLGNAFIDSVSKELNLYYSLNASDSKGGTTQKLGYDPSNITNAETQQRLAQMIIARPQEASSNSSGDDPKDFLTNTVLPFFKDISLKALGQEKGTWFYNVTESGIYGLAAAYLSYQNPKQNRFGKSFKVVFPSPYLDAHEQTDLILVDEAGMPDEVRKEIMTTLEKSPTDDPQAINSLSAGAKKFIYKVQVKTRQGDSVELSENDKQKKDKFASAYCTSKGFDNWDYLVLTYKRARSLVEKRP
jgi:hypothetical protein